MGAPVNAEIIQIVSDSQEQDRGKVIEIGSVVTVQFPDYRDGEPGETSRLLLVDTPVVDPKAVGLLFVETPIGRAILGKQAGDVVRVDLSDKGMSYDLEIIVVR